MGSIERENQQSQALAWIKSGLWGPGMGLFNFYKQEAEGLAGHR